MNIPAVIADLNQLRLEFLKAANEPDLSDDVIQSLISTTEDFHHSIFILNECGVVSNACVAALGETVTLLGTCLASLNRESHCSLTSPLPLGRPKLAIHREQLEYFLSVGFNKTQISRMLGVCARTITRRMNQYNLEGIQFSVLTDQELDRIVTEVQRQFPQSGYRQILAMLKCQGIYVKEHRLRDSLRRCDPLGSSLRWFATVKRRSYNVTSSLALWHLDGNHKLIRYVC